MSDENYAETILKAGIDMAVAQDNPNEGGRAYVIRRDGEGKTAVEYLEQAERPSRKRGTVTLNDAASFISYFKTHHASDDQAIYGDLKGRKLVAIFNEHGKKAAGWRDHKADFLLLPSEEWNLWMGRDGKGAAFESNAHFAIWLEDRIVDIVDPAQGKLLEIALSLKVNSKKNFGGDIKLQNGAMNLQYVNEVTAGAGPTGQELVVPEKFVIEIPVFTGLDEPKYKVDARFRFRIGDNGVSIWYELVRPQKVIEQAFKDVLAKIEEGTKQVVLFGTP